MGGMTDPAFRSGWCAPWTATVSKDQSGPSTAFGLSLPFLGFVDGRGGSERGSCWGMISSGEPRRFR